MTRPWRSLTQEQRDTLLHRHAVLVEEGVKRPARTLARMYGVSQSNVEKNLKALREERT